MLTYVIKTMIILGLTMTEGNGSGAEKPKYSPIQIINNFTLTGDEIERMRTTPVSPPGKGSQLENLGAKVDIKNRPEDIATDPNLTSEDARQRIETVESPWHKFVSNVVRGLSSRRASQDEVSRALAEARAKKSDILYGSKETTPTEDISDH